MLTEGEWSFEGLRLEFQTPVRELEDDLRHLAKSLRRGRQRLVVTPSRCNGCDFRFKERAPARFASPSRCPRCKSERIAPARLRVE